MSIENMKEGGHSVNLGVDGEILERILGKQGAWCGLDVSAQDRDSAPCIYFIPLWYQFI